MIKEVAFIVYPVKDMARAREFYEKTLGLQQGESFAHDGWVEYDVGGTAFGISNLFGGGPESAVAFEVDDLDAELARLRAAGVTFDGEVNDFATCRMFLIKDPDGNGLCIHQRKQRMSA